MDRGERFAQLVEWTSSALNTKIESIEFASEDASFRQYFRIRAGKETFIVMDSPVDLEEFETFIRIAVKFKQIGLNVPEIFAADHQRGFALITDFGTVTYLDRLSRTTANALYEDAIEALTALQKATRSNPEFLPPYSADLIVGEMELFKEWYLEQHLKINISESVSDVLDQAFTMLEAKAAEQPRVWVHRDYHSRNLMVVQDCNPGIIDFQDAVYGPVSYDLVSLLRDCYLEWDNESVARWIRLYLAKANQAGLETNFDERQFIEWFDWMGLQRHIKVAGIFSRLNYRDQKDKFLHDIPRVMNYIESVASKYQDLKPLHQLIVRLMRN